MSIKLEWPDGQDRHFSLIRERELYCIFTNANEEEQTGWCWWIKEENECWYVKQSSRGPGKSIAKESFGDILDEIHLQLIAEQELVDDQG